MGGASEMADSSTRLAEEMVQAETAYTRVVLEKASLRTVAAEMGISHTTVRERVRAYKMFLADERKQENIEERRASFSAELEEIKANARYVFNRNKDSKPLTAVGALNTWTATLVHQRAVDGLDMPKAVEAKQDITYTVVWDEGAEDQVQGE